MDILILLGGLWLVILVLWLLVRWHIPKPKQKKRR